MSKIKNKIIFPLIGLLLFVASIYFFSNKEKPPQISFQENNLQGLIFNQDKKVKVYTSEDLQQFENNFSNETLPKINLEKGINYIFFIEDLSYSNIYNRIKAPIDTELILYRWNSDLQSFEGNPGERYLNAIDVKDDELDNKIGEAYSVWILGSTKPVTVYEGLQVKNNSIASFKSESIKNGWNLMALSQEDLSYLKSNCNFEDLIFWNLADQNSFQRKTFDNTTSDSSIFWLNLKDESIICEERISLQDSSEVLDSENQNETEGNEQNEQENDLLPENINNEQNLSTDCQSTACDPLANDENQYTGQDSEPDPFESTEQNEPSDQSNSTNLVRSITTPLFIPEQEGDITIFENQTALANIVVDFEQEKYWAYPANELANFLNKVTGKPFNIIDDQSPNLNDLPINIYLGPSPQNEYLKTIKLDESDFIIDVKKSSIHIVSSGYSWGLKFAVYQFLEDYLGVRWLMPDHPDKKLIGTYFPEKETIKIPLGGKLYSPPIKSRQISGSTSRQFSTWAGYLRRFPRIRFHHNLYNLFDPKVFAETNPEFYPVLNGNLYIPPASKVNVGWQPNFLAENITEAAAERVIEYFSMPENEGQASYSLGVTDGSNFSEDEASLERLPNKLNYVGLQNYSEIYYKWVNDVIQLVKKQFPNKIFGGLAYNEVASPPSFSLDSNFIPYLTYERLLWIDSEREQIGKELNEEWVNKSEQLGWYDYLSGAGYMVPKVFFNQMAEYLKYGAENEVEGFYAEVAPFFGEGPKLYLLMKLLWDPYLNVNDLLDEWYSLSFGEEAGEEMKKYYQIWEDFWTNDIKETDWFKETSGHYSVYWPHYLYFQDERDRGLDDGVIAKIIESRNLFDNALSYPKKEDEQIRLSLIEKAFQYYEASVWALWGELQSWDYSEIDLPSQLEIAQKTICFAQKRRELIDEFYLDPLFGSNQDLVGPLDEAYNARYLRGKHWSKKAISQISETINQNFTIKNYVNGLLNSDEACASFKKELEIAISSKPNLLENPSFENDEQWSLYNPEVGTLNYSNEVSKTGQRSILFDSTSRASIISKLDITPGQKFYISGWIYVPNSSKYIGDLELRVPFKDLENNYLNDFLSVKIYPPFRGSWHKFSVFTEDFVDTSTASSLELLVLFSNGHYTSEKIYIDDLKLIEVE